MSVESDFPDGSQPTYVSAMSLRDWFAGQVIGAVVSAYALSNSSNQPLPQIGLDHLPRNCAALAYKIADAILAAKEK